MSTFKDFDAARAAKGPAAVNTLVLAGETFDIPANTGVLPLMDMAAAASTIDTDEDVSGREMLGVMRAMTELLEDAVAPADRARFHTALRTFNPDQDELIEIIGTVVQGVTGRPLVPPSPSPASPAPVSPTSKVASLSTEEVIASMARAQAAAIAASPPPTTRAEPAFSLG